MCGIAGFISGDKQSDVRAAGETLARMCGSIAHRGPDDEGMLVEGRAAIGMRRLSIIDLAGGHQPLSGCDPAVSLVFNGEIYNFRELQTLLEARGHHFRTHSDTEAIVHAYEQFGAACVEHLRGMFAFAIWDARAQMLFIARDRAGEKPLYYSLTDGGSLVFGSELKCLLEHPEVRRETDAEALDAYLTFGYIPDPLSVFRDVRKLPPGHTLTFEGGRVAVKSYWDFTYEPVTDARPVEDYLEELRALLDESVRMQLVADVPRGAFLSGGVDSSTVVALMARAVDRPVKTFSIGFNEDSYDELRFARVAARAFGTDHHEFVVTPEICSVVDELVRHFDEPFADSSAIPPYVVSKLAREQVTVVLSAMSFSGATRATLRIEGGAVSRVCRASCARDSCSPWAARFRTALGVATSYTTSLSTRSTATSRTSRFSRASPNARSTPKACARSCKTGRAERPRFFTRTPRASRRASRSTPCSISTARRICRATF